MPRKRKYDVHEDYPIKVFVGVPIKVINKLEKMGFEDKDIPKLINRLLTDFVEKNEKNG